MCADGGGGQKRDREGNIMEQCSKSLHSCLRAKRLDS